VLWPAVCLKRDYALQLLVQGGSNMTGTNCDLFTHNQCRSYLNHLVLYHTVCDLAEGRDRWWAVVNAVMNLRVS
jgi:hypothetical protein